MDKTSARILVFGDSIGYGAWDEQGGWVDRLKELAHVRTISSQSKQKYQVLNLCIGGNTSRDIKQRIEKEISDRHSSSWPFVIIIAVGTNDARTNDGTPEVDETEYRSNLESIITTAKSHTTDVLIVGLPTIGQDVLPFKAHEYTNERIRTYDQIAREIADTSGVSFVPVQEDFIKSDRNLFFADLLHPNTDGHSIILQAVRMALQKFDITL